MDDGAKFTQCPAGKTALRPVVAKAGDWVAESNPVLPRQQQPAVTVVLRSYCILFSPGSYRASGLCFSRCITGCCSPQGYSKDSWAEL